MLGHTRIHGAKCGVWSRSATFPPTLTEGAFSPDTHLHSNADHFKTHTNPYTQYVLECNWLRTENDYFTMSLLYSEPKVN